MSDDIYDAFRYALKAMKMGCDIHLYSEIKKDGKWVAEKADTYKEEQEEGEDYVYKSLSETGNTSRNYWLFGLLADVRTTCEYGFEAKGMPEDCCDILRGMSEYFSDEPSDWHSHSYLTIKELKDKAAEILLHSDSDSAELLQMLTSFIESLGPTPEDQLEDRRIVFWFDN